jgi:1-acyl-sn-glycerol-3-phosphate acyltransferase
LLALTAGYHRLTIEGADRLPQEGAGLLLVKHRATRDSLLLSWILYHYTKRMANYLVKYGAAGLPPQLLTWVGGIPVIRTKDILKLGTRAERHTRLQQARAMRQQALDYVAWLYTQKELVVVYPEGTFYPHQLGPLQIDSIRHVYETTKETELDIPLIPIGTAYAYQRGRRSQAIFRIGDPCKPRAFSALAPLVDEIREQLRRLSGLA